MTTPVRQARWHDRQWARASWAAAAGCMLAALSACQALRQLTTAPKDPLTWTGDVAADSNRAKVLAYADALEWDLRREVGDSAVVDPTTGAEAVIVPNKNAHAYKPAEIAEGRFIARIRPVRGSYQRLGIVDGDAGHIYIWVRISATDSTQRQAVLIYESRPQSLAVTVQPRPRSEGPHRAASDESHASWVPLTDAVRRGAALPADPHGLGVSRASLDWISAARGLIAAVMPPPAEPRRAVQGTQLIPWGDCSQYCCELGR